MHFLQSKIQWQNLILTQAYLLYLAKVFYSQINSVQHGYYPYQPECTIYSFDWNMNLQCTLMICGLISELSPGAKTAAEKKRSEISMVLSIKTTSIHDNDQQQTTENVPDERKSDIENGDTLLLAGTGKQSNLQKTTVSAGLEPTGGQRQQAEQTTVEAPPSVRSLANNIEQKTGHRPSTAAAASKPAGSFTIRAASGPPQVSPGRLSQKGGTEAGKSVGPSQERHKRVLTTLEVKQAPPQRPQVRLLDIYTVVR